MPLLPLNDGQVEKSSFHGCYRCGAPLRLNWNIQKLWFRGCCSFMCCFGLPQKAPNSGEKKAININNFRNCPGNGWGSTLLMCSLVFGEKHRHINKIPRKSQRKMPAQSRDFFCVFSCLFFFPAPARHVMRTVLFVRPKGSHRYVSLKESCLKPLLILKHAAKRSTEQTSMTTKWFKHIAI